METKLPIIYVNYEMFKSLDVNQYKTPRPFRKIKTLIILSDLHDEKSHYENMPMYYNAIFHGCKKDNFQMKKCDVFLIFAQNID